MIKPKKSKWRTMFWKYYFRFIIWTDFNDFVYDKEVQFQDKGLLVLANHFSWWDGFFVHHLNEVLMKRKFHVMMLEEQLSKLSFLRFSGAFSIDKKSGRKMLESLDYAAALLQNPANMVLFFPQGRIQSMHWETLKLEKGASRLIAKVGQENLQIVLCANLIDYHSRRKPTVHVYLKPLTTTPGSFEALAEAFNNHYQAAKETMKQRSE